MKKQFSSRIFILPLVMIYVPASWGCVHRPGAVFPDNNSLPSVPPAAVETEPPPPSPILRKEKGPTPVNPENPSFLGKESSSSQSLDAINDYLYSNDSIKTPKLTGAAKVLNDFWNLAKFAIGGVAFIGFIETQHKK